MNEKGEGAAVLQEGIFIDKRNEVDFKVHLYRLHSFYAEIFYDSQDNEVVRYRAFKPLTRLASFCELLGV